MDLSLDFLKIDQLISEEDKLVRDSVRAFVDEKILPNIAKHFREGTFPRELVPQIAELGLLGAALKEYGGAGVSQVAYGLIMQELERGDSGLRSFVSVQSGLVIYPIYAFGDDAQKSKWLPQLIQGKAIGCFGLTEPDFGSNPAGMLTSAKKTDKGYILNGTKRWITNGSVADVAVVFARVEEGIAAFLVEKGTPGFTQREMEGKLSLRASWTGELILEDCEIPASNRLPGAKGLKAALACLNQARFGIAWGAIGAAMACFEEALSYSKSRIQFNRPLSGFQLIQQKLVEMYTGILHAQLLGLRLSELKEGGELDPVAISIGKRNNVAMARNVAREARDILGANGVSDEYVSMRHMCNLESVYTYEGTHNIHTLIIGQALTGTPAFE